MFLAALLGARQLLGAAPPQASAPPLSLDERVAAVVK
jgi:hypothetical protein